MQAENPFGILRFRDALRRTSSAWFTSEENYKKEREEMLKYDEADMDFEMSYARIPMLMRMRTLRPHPIIIVMSFMMIPKMVRPPRLASLSEGANVEAMMQNFLQVMTNMVAQNRKFDEFSRYAPHLVDTEEHKVRHFEAGLWHDLYKVRAVLQLGTYVEVLERAEIIAKDDFITETKSVNNEKKSWNNNKRKQYGHKGGKKKHKYNGEMKDFPLCAICKKYHSGECFKKTGTCFRYEKIRHMDWDCSEAPKE
ncbi:hypothetical protein FNV43_RR21584 [Rhamnella rubrinervis]|uniref:Uncharacterized protein n=1 Tax=Rhamnella rubrinervis TaxID=2594499 RepID=A0A8K0GQ90_9ROSA|nr:hypothetical protein FNV43_RR21584 [Rhamnella rubrinervis]